jgi:hypothetical protein
MGHNPDWECAGKFGVIDSFKKLVKYWCQRYPGLWEVIWEDYLQFSPFGFFLGILIPDMIRTGAKEASCIVPVQSVPVPFSDTLCTPFSYDPVPNGGADFRNRREDLPLLSRCTVTNPLQIYPYRENIFLNNPFLGLVWSE